MARRRLDRVNRYVLIILPPHFRQECRKFFMPPRIAVYIFSQIALPQDHTVLQIQYPVAPARRPHIVGDHDHALSLSVKTCQRIQNMQSRLGIERVMLSMDYKQNFDRCHDRLNGEHVTLVMSGDPGEVRPFLTRVLGEDAQVTDYYMGDSLCMVGSFAYNGGEANTELVFLEKEEALSRSIGRV